MSPRNPQKATIKVGDVTFSEKSIKPPSIASTGKLDTSSSANSVTAGGGFLKSFIPSLFSEVGDATASVLFDPTEVADIYAALNVEKSIVITWADGATLTFKGWLDSFDPDDGDTIDASTANTATITICTSGDALPVGDVGAV